MGIPQCLLLEPRPSLEPIVVELLRGKATDLGVEAPGVVQKQTAVVQHRSVLAQQMVEGGDFGPLGMAGLEGLLQLLWIADQDQGFGGRSDRQSRRQRHLARLVDDEYVD